MEKQHVDETRKNQSRKDSRDGSFHVGFPSTVAPRGSMPGKGVAVQAQLETTAPGDELEREADSTADLVLRKIETGSTGAVPPPSGNFRRSVSAYGGSSVTLPSRMESQIRGSLGGGQALPNHLRSQMEGAFGQSFSNVHVHTDSAAAEMSRSIGARAFTYGNDIFFNQGQYSPYSSSGQHLIAHELTHTLQQGNRVARRDSDEVIRARVKMNAGRFPDARVWRVVVRDLFYLSDNDAIDCYFDALTRGPEWLTSYAGAWSEDLKAFGKSWYESYVPKKCLDSDYQEQIAAYHWEKLSKRIDEVESVIVDRHGKPYGKMVQYRHKLTEVAVSNRRSSSRPSWMISVENTLLQYLDDQTYAYNWKIKPEGLLDRHSYELAFGAMFALVILGSLGAAVGAAAMTAGGAGAAGTAGTVGTAGTAGTTGTVGTVTSTAGRAINWFARYKSAKAAWLFGKDTYKLGYDLIMAGEEDWEAEAFLKKKMAQYAVTLIADELDAGISGGIKGPMKEAIKDVVVGVIVTMINDEIEYGRVKVEDVTAAAITKLLGQLKGIPGMTDELFAGLEEPLSQIVSSAVNTMFSMLASPVQAMKDVEPDSDVAQLLKKRAELEESWGRYFALLKEARDKAARRT